MLFVAFATADLTRPLQYRSHNRYASTLEKPNFSSDLTTPRELIHEYPDANSTITDIKWRYDGVVQYDPTQVEPLRRFEWVV